MTDEKKVLKLKFVSKKILIIWGFCSFFPYACSTSGISSPDGMLDVNMESSPKGSIIFSEESQTTLVLLETGTIYGQYFDSSGKPASASLTIALIGDTYDSTLLDTEVETESDGKFEVAVRAGSVETHFDLRVVANDGAQNRITINVVSVQGGAFLIKPIYNGRRLVKKWFANLYSFSECEEVPQSIPSFTGSFSSEMDSMLFSHIPENRTFEILIRATPCGEGEVGFWCLPGQWINGCKVETVAANQVVTVDVEVDDYQNIFGGNFYEVFFTIDASRILGNSINELLSPVLSFGQSCETMAGFILDEIQKYFSTDTEKQSLFIIARRESGMDGSISNLLCNSDARDIPSDLNAILQNIFVSIQEIIFHGEILSSTYTGFWWDDDEDDVISAEHSFESIRAGGRNILSDVLSVEGNSSELIVDYNHDIITLGKHSFPLGGGTFLRYVAEDVAIPQVSGSYESNISFEEYLRSKIDCSSISHLICSNETLSGLAESGDSIEWYRNLCLEILSNVEENINDEAERIDLIFSSIQFGGYADFLDLNGYPNTLVDGNRVGIGYLNEAKWGNELIPGPPSLIIKPSIQLPP